MRREKLLLRSKDPRATIAQLKVGTAELLEPVPDVGRNKLRKWRKAGPAGFEVVRVYRIPVVEENDEAKNHVVLTSFVGLAKTLVLLRALRM